MPDNPIPDIEPSFEVIVRRVHGDLGGRASLDDVIDVMESEHPDVFLRNARSALKSKVRNALTDHDATGMPHASSIDGRYVQRGLFDVDDYRVTIERCIEQSTALLATAIRLSDECADRFGVRFPVPVLDVDDEAGAA